jgi:hypothetical protein
MLRASRLGVSLLGNLHPGSYWTYILEIEPNFICGKVKLRPIEIQSYRTGMDHTGRNRTGYLKFRCIEPGTGMDRGNDGEIPSYPVTKSEIPSY